MTRSSFFVCFSCLSCVLINSDANYAQEEGNNSARFPLVVGNRWEYHVIATQQFSDPASSQNASWESKVTWEIMAREIVLNQNTFRFQTTHQILSGPDSGTIATVETWFTMRGDTLQAVASRGYTDANPVTTQLFKPVVQEEEDPYEWHYISLVFPLSKGKSWNTENSNIVGNESGLTDVKVVEAQEVVSVPAGVFETFKVIQELKWKTQSILTTEQWFSSIGMVKMRSIERIDDESLIAEMELERFQLHDPPTAIEETGWGRLKSGQSRNHSDR